MKLIAGKDRIILRRALISAIEWNESLIDAHTPTLRYKGMCANPYKVHIRRWHSQIASWRRLILKLSNKEPK